MPTFNAAPEADEVGFMGGVLGRAKKVLFPDAADAPVEATAAVPAARTPKAKKSKSRGARRARLKASNSSLANIASVGSGAASVKVRSGDSGKPERVGSGKENAAPKEFSKRGRNTQTMDSLAATFGSDGRDSVHEASAHSMGAGVVVHRRKSRSSLQSTECSLLVCEDAVKREKPSRNAVNRDKAKSSQEEVNMTEPTPNTYEPQRALVDSLAKETVHTLTEADTSFLGNRRRGRTKHPVSSLVQEAEVPKAMGKRNSGGGGGISSLMALPASTQKTQKARSLVQKKATRKKKSSANLGKDGAQPKSAADGVTAALQQDNQPIDDVNVASLSNHVEALTIGEDQPMDCSTPMTIRRRAVPGGITSPPGFIHRYSTLSNSNIFPGRSPMPDSNPSLKKRFDGKKTPDKMTALATLKSPEKMSISPNPYACKPLELNVDVGEDEGDFDVGGNDAVDDMSQICLSPRIMVTSSSFMSSPDAGGGETLSDARSNLFSSPAGKLEDDENTSSKRQSGSAVLEVETAPPLDAERPVDEKPKVPIRGSAVIEVERADPLANKEIKAPKRKTKAKKEPKSKANAKTKTRAARPRNDEKVNDEKDSEQPRRTRSGRQSQPTDRLTYDGGKAKAAAAASTRTCTNKGADDEKEPAPTTRSGRQAKPTDRLTVTSWKKKSKKSDRRVSFAGKPKEVEEHADDVVEERANPPASLGSTAPSVDEPKLEGSSAQNASVPLKASEIESSEGGMWSNVEVTKLRDAQKEIDPTSRFFWQEVSVLVGTKSSSECQMKWQSMVATPKVVRRPTKKKDAARNLSKSEADASMSEDEDDLFNSSPFREADVENEDGPATKFSSFGGGSFGLSPFVKPKATKSKKEEQSALKFRRKGYNSYIENLRKDIIRNKKKDPSRVQTATQSSAAPSQICADSGNAESQMSGKLLADGTVAINEQDEDLDEMDDMWGDGEDEEE